MGIKMGYESQEVLTYIPLNKECPFLKTKSKSNSIKMKMKLTQMLQLLELLPFAAPLVFTTGLSMCSSRSSSSSSGSIWVSFIFILMEFDFEFVFREGHSLLRGMQDAL